jgi:hypothetical protein
VWEERVGREREWEERESVGRERDDLQCYRNQTDRQRDRERERERERDKKRDGNEKRDSFGSSSSLFSSLFLKERVVKDNNTRFSIVCLCVFNVEARKEER